MAKQKFSKEQQQEFIKLYNEGYSCTKIAKLYNTTQATVSSSLKRNGVNVINKQNETNYDLDSIIKDYNKGESLTNIAKKYKIDRHVLSSKLKKLNIRIINRQNEVKFNESVFDCIDSEEKAY